MGIGDNTRRTVQGPKASTYGPGGTQPAPFSVASAQASVASTSVPWGHITGTPTTSLGYGITDDLLKANNLSDVANATTALANLAGAPLASPTFTGVPAAPTATAGTNTTQLATTAFVTAAVGAGGTYLPLAGGTMAGLITLDANAKNVTSVPATQAILDQGLTLPGYWTVAPLGTQPFYYPGLTWSDTTDHITKPKAAIYVQVTSSGSNIIFGMSGNYATGVTQHAQFNYLGGLNLGNFTTQAGICQVTGLGLTSMTQSTAPGNNQSQFRIDITTTGTNYGTIDFAAQDNSPTQAFARIGATNTGSGSILAFGVSNSYVTGITSTPLILKWDQSATFSGAVTAASLTVSGTTTLTGVPTGPTAAAGTNNTQLATTAFVITNSGSGVTQPYIVGTPDAPPASAATINDEFTEGTILGKWAWLNQGSATLTFDSITNGFLLAPAAVNANVRAIIQATSTLTSTTLWAVSCKIEGAGFYWSSAGAGSLNTTSMFGMVLYESATGKLMTWGPDLNNSGLSIGVYASTTSRTSHVQQGSGAGLIGTTALPLYLRISFDNSSYHFWASLTGRSWYHFQSITKATNFTTQADNVGLFVDNESAVNTQSVQFAIDWFRETTSLLAP